MTDTTTSSLKRKAQHDLPSPPHKRPKSLPGQQQQVSQAPSSIPSPRPISIHEPASINAIIREHCRTRLYVRPIAWTSVQIQLLECHFTPMKARPNSGRDKASSTHTQAGLAITQNAAEEVDATGSQQQQQQQQQQHKIDILRAATQLSSSYSMTVKKFAIQELLSVCNIHPIESCTNCPNTCPGHGSGRLMFRFNRKVVCVLKTDGVFSLFSSRTSSATTPFLLAYIGLDTVRSLRQKLFSMPRGKKPNRPLACQREKLLRALQPLNEVEDPYIVAVLIALAQEQRQQQQNQPANNKAADQSNTTSLEPTSAVKEAQNVAPCFKVCLLSVSGILAQRLYVYTASIPSGFLDKFDSPSRFSPSCPVQISYHWIPLTNPEKLMRRLQRALNEE